MRGKRLQAPKALSSVRQSVYFTIGLPVLEIRRSQKFKKKGGADLVLLDSQCWRIVGKESLLVIVLQTPSLQTQYL